MPVLAWMYRFFRWILGCIFIYSGTTKLLAPKTFAVLIEAYGLVPDGLIMPVAMILPVMEVVAGAGLMVDIRGSLTVIAGLLVLFITILGYGILMGLDVDCGCFGPEDPEAEAFHGLRAALYRDMLMMAAVGFLYGWRRYCDVRPRTIRRLVNGRFAKINIMPTLKNEES
nr:MauE/DoxX family redox-associated membrane protein [Desulfosarcina alkanivorans]